MVHLIPRFPQVVVEFVIIIIASFRTAPQDRIGNKIHRPTPPQPPARHGRTQRRQSSSIKPNSNRELTVARKVKEMRKHHHRATPRGPSRYFPLWGRHLSAGAASLRRHGLGPVLVMLSAVDVLLEDGFGLINFPLRLELPDMVVHRAAVGPAAGLVEVEVFVVYFSANAAPVVRACQHAFPRWHC